MIFADKILYPCPFNTNDTDGNAWPTSEVRASLNGGNYVSGTYPAGESFYELAFKDSEKSIIKLTSIKTYKYNSSSDEVKDSPSQDYVFLLDVNEIQDKNTDYGFKSDDDRVTEVTDYAEKKGAFRYIGKGPFWLRSPGEPGDGYYLAAHVDLDGTVDMDLPVNDYSLGVRPALYLDLNSVLFASKAEGGK